ncbi:MAG TPA: XdhC family protein [Chloroflexota bacterium]
MKLEGVSDIVPLVAEARRQGTGLVIATLVGNSTDLDFPLGIRMAIAANTEVKGGFSSVLDPLVVEDAGDALKQRRSVCRSYDCNQDRAWRVRPGSGHIDVFYQVLARPLQLVIVGAGHIALPLSRIAAIHDLRVTVIDDRAEFATRERFPDAETIVVGPYTQSLSQIEMDNDTFVVLVTRGHVHDQACLELLINSSAHYIGMIGSKRRVRTVLDHLKDEGYDPLRLESVYAPIGLAIGAETPAEIATAILAEIIAIIHGVPSVQWRARGAPYD